MSYEESSLSSPMLLIASLETDLTAKEVTIENTAISTYPFHLIGVQH
jgi:hypothetical protein